MQKSLYNFRFSVLQWMAVTAVLAVAFAVMPGGALVLSFLGTFWLLERRHPRPNPTALGQAFGCLSWLCGFVAGAVIGGMSVGTAIDCGLPSFAAGLLFGVVGAIIAGTVGHFVALTLIDKPLVPRKRSDSGIEIIQKEIQLTERLLAQAQMDGDEEVWRKLRKYKSTLLQRQNQNVGDGSHTADHA